MNIFPVKNNEIWIFAKMENFYNKKEIQAAVFHWKSSDDVNFDIWSETMPLRFF